ncbi:hypothetical protein QCA50_006431 [Cerrena zonata]|uniref:non-specific serine/threonine protein kinase n=1 Tax=Cerrena zonata TaxID=2478898 RepID=A0AAW0GE17_9APHY
MFFAKLKILFSRKPASDRSARQPQQTLEIQTINNNTSVVKLPTRCVSARPSSLLVLAKTAQGQEAEKLFPQQFIQEVSFYCTLQIDRPISVGALANWIQTLITDGVRVSELNYILGIDCQDLTLTQSVDAVVPLDIVIAGASAILDIPIATDAYIPVALCNDIYTTPTTPKQSPLAFIVDEPTPTTPCPKSSLPESTPILCRLTALQSVNDLSVLDIKQPQFTSTQSTPFTERLSTQDFDIIGALGKGGFGTAYAARFNWNGGCVALKAIRKRVREVKRKRVPRADTFGEDVFAPAVKGAANNIGSVSAKNCQSVIDEWLAMQRLSGLGGVAEVLASWHDSNNFYIAMPLYNGGDLQTRLMREGGRFSLDVARFYMAELLNGLENIHSRGVVHRDLKLANVLIGPDGRLKIADFGLARCFEQYASEFERTINPELATMDKAGADRFSEVTNTGCGTPEYAAPEVFREDLYSYNVDVWSAGVMAFKMIVGRSPWTGADNDVALALHVTEGKYEIENREQEEYGINEDAVFFIRRALDKDASTRPSAARMKGHLFFKSFDWSGLENNTLEAPWVPNASEAFMSRSCQQGTDIDAGSPLSSSEDHIPYFNYLSPRMADAPTTLPTMVSSPSFPPCPSACRLPYRLNPLLCIRHSIS